MKAVQVTAINTRGETILRENKDKFGIGRSVAAYAVRRMANAYTDTTYSDNPFTILVTIKPKFEFVIKDNDLMDKVKRSTHRILSKYGGSINDVEILLLSD